MKLQSTYIRIAVKWFFREGNRVFELAIPIVLSYVISWQNFAKNTHYSTDMLVMLFIFLLWIHGFVLANNIKMEKEFGSFFMTLPITINSLAFSKTVVHVCIFFLPSLIVMIAPYLIVKVRGISTSNYPEQFLLFTLFGNLASIAICFYLYKWITKIRLEPPKPLFRIKNIWRGSKNEIQSN